MVQLKYPTISYKNKLYQGNKKTLLTQTLHRKVLKLLRKPRLAREIIAKLLCDDNADCLKKYCEITWKNTESIFLVTSKIKHETLCDKCKAWGLKNVSNNISNKIIAFLFFWIIRLYLFFFFFFSLLRLYLTEKSFGTSFKFRYTLLFKANKTKCFPIFL